MNNFLVPELAETLRVSLRKPPKYTFTSIWLFTMLKKNIYFEEIWNIFCYNANGFPAFLKKYG